MIEVSDPGLVRLFQSSADAASAFFNDCHSIWMHRFESDIETRYKASGGGLEIIAEVLQERLQDHKVFGLAFIGSINDSHGSGSEHFAIASKQKEHLRIFIERLAKRMGLTHPEFVATVAVLVIDQTIACTLTTGCLREIQAARMLFDCLQHA